MMYLFDKELRLIDIIGRDHIISFNYEREKNGLYFIEAVLPLSKTNKDGYVNLYAKLNKATYVGHHDKDGRFQMHRTIVLEIEKDEIFLRGVHLFFDEAKAFGVVKTRIFKDSEVSQVAPYLFSPLGWKLHSSDPSPSRTITFDDISVLEARKMLIEVYGFEFDYWFDFDGQKITGKWYTIKRQIGKETYKRYRYGSNALNVKAEEDYSEVYTAVIGKGALLEPIERAAAQKKYEADKKRVEAEQQRIKDAYKKAKAAYEADRKATIRKYEADVAAWKKQRDAITAQRKARTKRKPIKGKKLPKLPRLVTPPKPKYPKAKPAPKQGKLPKLPKRPEDAKAPGKDEAKDERRVEFTNVVWKKPANPLNKPKGQRVLVDPVTTDLFGYRDESGKRVPKTAVVVFDDVADPAKVLSLSYNWLKENSRPKAIFSVEVADDEPLDLGDTVHIIYKEANQVHASRVFKVRDNLIADTRSVEFGDGEHFTKDGKVAKIGKDVQSLRRRVNDEIYARKVEFDTEFDRQVQLIQEAYDEALADALVEVDALAESITTEIDTAQDDFIDDIEAAITLAEVEAEERAEELEFILFDELAEQKSYLQEEIKQSYDKAVSVATEKAEEKGREIDGIIRMESETLKAEIDKAKSDATEAATAAAATATKALTDKLGEDVKDAKATVAKLSGDTNIALNKANTVAQELATAQKSLADVSKWQGLNGTAVEQTIKDYKAKIWQKDIDALGYEGRNLVLESDKVNKGSEYLAARYKLTEDWSEDTYTVTIWGTVNAETQKLGVWMDNGSNLGAFLTPNKTRDVWTATFKGRISDKSQQFPKRTLSVYNYPTATTGASVITKIKLERGNKATPWSKAPEDVEAKVVTVEQTANAAKTQAEAIGKDYVKQSSVSVASDGVVIGSKKIGGDNLASAIAVSPGNVDIITKAMRVTGDMKVAGDIKSLSLAAVNADIANLRTKIVTANSIDATKIKVDAALINKLDTSEILSKKIIASKAFLDEVKAKSIAATRGDIAWLRSNVITADSVDAKALKVDTALADKLFATDVLTTKLVADSTYSKSVKALAVQAARADIGWLKTNVLTANSIGTAALQANSVSADKLKVDTAFVNKLMADKALVDSLKAKSMEAVNANIGTLRTSILSANVVKASNIASDNAMIDKLFATDALVKRLTAKQAFIRDIKAIDLSANRITGGILRSVTGGMQFNLDKNTLDFFGNSTIHFHTSGNLLKYESNKMGAYISFTSASDGTPVVLMGANRDLSFNPNLGSFTGVIARSGEDSISLIGDTIYLKNNESEKSTGHWAITTWIKGSKDRYIFGTSKGYNYHIGGAGFEMESMWTDKLHANDIKTGTTNLYLGVDSEVRVVSKAGYNGGKPSYRAVKVSAVHNASYVGYKKDIEKWDYDALSVVTDSMDIMQYRLIGDDSQRLRRGLVVGGDSETPVEFVSEDGVDSYEMASWSLRAIQQLGEITRDLKQQNEDLRKEVSELKDMITKGGGQ